MRLTRTSTDRKSLVATDQNFSIRQEDRQSLRRLTGLKHTNREIYKMVFAAVK